MLGNVGFRAWTATTTATATGASHVVDGRGRPREGHARLQRNLREKEKCRRQLQRAGPQETFPENSSQGIGELPKCPESSDYGYSIAYGASGLVYQEKGLKTRHMLACQEEWASPGQEPPGKTRFSVKALNIGKWAVAGYDYVVVAVHEGKLIFWNTLQPVIKCSLNLSYSLQQN